MKIETFYFEPLGEEIIYHIGKNEKDNFVIIDNASKDDIWFHANDVSSCHVVMKMPESEQIDKKHLKVLIKKGALLCKQNTNKLVNENKVEFCYTSIKNVSKTKKMGCVDTKNTKTIFV